MSLSANLVYITCIISLSAVTIVFITLNNPSTKLVNFNSFLPMHQSSDNMSLMEYRFDMRNLHLMGKCLKYGLEEPDIELSYYPRSKNFIAFKDYNLVWCPVFKAASSSWLHKFNVLDGLPMKFLNNTKSGKITLTRTMHPVIPMKEVYMAANYSTKFLIVRHPFERLVSGYCDKLASSNKYYEKLYGSKIIKHYRKPGYVPLNPKYPTFPEFVHWLNDLARDGKPIDEHFLSTTDHCTPCLYPFDYIIKVETMEEDERYFLNQIGLPELISSEWQNRSKCGNTTTDTKSLYSQLTRRELLRLYRYYRFDFELFGYSAVEYFNMLRV